MNDALNNDYSVAIRTLGTSGDALRRELLSLHAQTIQPREIVIYIAKGYPRPDFQIGMERYVEVDKGMIAQRALQYREITAENILLLDDDVELSPNSAEILLNHLADGVQCRHITALSNVTDATFVLVVIVIIMVGTDVEETVTLQMDNLMYFEI